MRHPLAALRRHASPWTVLSLALGAATCAFACSGSKIESGFDQDGGGGPTGTTPGDPNSDGGPNGPSPFGSSDGSTQGQDSSADDCPASATLVYVTGEGAKLYSFYPPMQTFTLIGTFNCLDSPTHMTVDRQGVAWVVNDGKLYKASTSDATCSEVTTWKTSNTFDDFALTFIGVSNVVDNTLYLMNDSQTLGSFDIAGGVLTTIGTVQIPSTEGDMTSNGDGTLYFLRDVSKPTLYNVNPSTGAVISQNAITASGGGSQALAFWGGSFYAFESDQIYQWDPTMKTTMSIGTAPLQVTGAGQSTCVPKVPPTTK